MYIKKVYISDPMIFLSWKDVKFSYFSMDARIRNPLLDTPYGYKISGLGRTENRLEKMWIQIKTVLSHCPETNICNLGANECLFACITVTTSMSDRERIVKKKKTKWTN